ncbi:thioredoxin family protein [Flavitalea sp. BT771]|uniref:thioredoxin family protein n=1 Tax=Flavitalea sp. BT771 TaxID=3063329 RepID=UPI0026E47458|nr:thioredoxin family protein [Flavitalea sp. BT771]MDO6435450.1 thioredoxin family protein [Flavitalea sp. BT771]MDV6224190.1 thioredoxin family protein [Flavitalea sp. BT771]
MKHWICFWLIIFYTSSVVAQSGSPKGMHFFKGSWSDLQAAARHDHKMIFIDVYTDWCGPCKYMDKFIFTNPSVGGKYNTQFVNYKLNAEKGEGVELAKKYNVTAYPTLLFLNSNGYLVHKVIGEKEVVPFIELAVEALKQGTDPANLGNLEKAFDEGARTQLFLRTYLDRLTALNLDNSAVLDEYFKSLPAEVLEKDTTLLYLARCVTGARTASLIYLVNHYDLLSDPAKETVTSPLFEKLVRMGAGQALREKRLIEYEGLVAFGRRLYGLKQNQLSFLNRLNLLYSVMIRDYLLVKQAGYTMATGPSSVPVDTIRAEDERRYNQIMHPYLTGEKDSTKVLDFAEEKKYVSHLYAREIAEQLYTAAQAFAQLPSTDTQALQDACLWIKRCIELIPDPNSTFSNLLGVLESKLKNRSILIY